TPRTREHWSAHKTRRGSCGHEWTGLLHLSCAYYLVRRPSDSFQRWLDPAFMVAHLLEARLSLKANTHHLGHTISISRQKTQPNIIATTQSSNRWGTERQAARHGTDGRGH